VAVPLSQPLTVQAAPKNISLVVNNATDNNISTCAAGPSGTDCTLRGAINKINSGTLTFATITFAPQVTLTALLHSLPAIVVTGTTILGNSGVPRLDALFMANGNVFSVSAPISQISGLSIVNGHTFTDGVFSDIWVEGGTQVWIDHNYLGTLPPGPAVRNCNPNPDGGSLVSHNSGYGVFVDTGVTGDTSTGGESVYIYNNTVGCHQGHGIVLNGASYVHIGQDGYGGLAGNFIGANNQGVGLQNGAGGIGDGIDLVASGSSGARFNIIRGNTIENNGRFGILLSGTGVNNAASTYSNLIAGNDIGLDFLGPYPNGSNGIQLVAGAFLNIIGGAANADRNVISGNGGSGIRIVNSNGNLILGNYIGTGLSGALAVLSPGVSRPGQKPPSPSAAMLIIAPGNHLDGIELNGSDSNEIGGSAAGDRNVISGNGQAGVLIDASKSNLVSYNLIGLNAAGTSALANGQDGFGSTMVRPPMTSAPWRPARRNLFLAMPARAS
jgi:parallel beta-helix repeat protein